MQGIQSPRTMLNQGEVQTGGDKHPSALDPQWDNYEMSSTELLTVTTYIKLFLALLLVLLSLSHSVPLTF